MLNSIPAVLLVPIALNEYQVIIHAGELIQVDIENSIALINGIHMDIYPHEYRLLYN